MLSSGASWESQQVAYRVAETPTVTHPYAVIAQVMKERLAVYDTGVVRRLQLCTKLAPGLCFGYATTGARALKTREYQRLEQLFEDTEAVVAEAVYWMVISCLKIEGMQKPPTPDVTVLSGEKQLEAIDALLGMDTSSVIVIHCNAIDKKRPSHTVFAVRAIARKLFQFFDSARGCGLYSFPTQDVWKEAVVSRFRLGRPSLLEGYLWAIEVHNLE